MTTVSPGLNASNSSIGPDQHRRNRWSGFVGLGMIALLMSSCVSADDVGNSGSQADSEDQDVQDSGQNAIYDGEPYDPELLDAEYPSDGHHDLIPLLDGFDDLLENHPEILAEDMAKVVEINHGSAQNEEQRERALDDQYEDMSVTMSEGLGEELGKIYKEGRENGDLPKTEALLLKDGPDQGRVARDGSSTNPAKEHWVDDAPRPYIAEPDAIDYFDREDGDAYDSTGGAFPSGHTSQAYWQGVTLATLLPELADGVLARTSEAGNNRIVIGVHYPTDVIGGRMSGASLVANRWADEEFQPLLEEARDELVGYLEEECGADLEQCIAEDSPYVRAEDAAELYTERMTYGFEQIGEAGQDLEVPADAPSLLITAHSDLDEEQRRQVLELTAIDSGYPLDKPGPDGGWQRIDLLAAMTADVEVDEGGTVTLVD